MFARPSFGVEAFQTPLGLGLTEIARASVPKERLGGIATHTAQDILAEKSWIEGGAQSQRRPPISGIGGTLIEEARGDDIAATKQSVTAR